MAARAHSFDGFDFEFTVAFYEHVVPSHGDHLGKFLCVFQKDDESGADGTVLSIQEENVAAINDFILVFDIHNDVTVFGKSFNCSSSFEAIDSGLTGFAFEKFFGVVFLAKIDQLFSTGG